MQLLNVLPVTPTTITKGGIAVLLIMGARSMGTDLMFWKIIIQRITAVTGPSVQFGPMLDANNQKVSSRFRPLWHILTISWFYGSFCPSPSMFCLTVMEAHYLPCITKVYQLVQYKLIVVTFMLSIADCPSDYPYSYNHGLHCCTNYSGSLGNSPYFLTDSHTVDHCSTAIECPGLPETKCKKTDPNNKPSG